MEMDELQTGKRSRLDSANGAAGDGWACRLPASSMKVGDASGNRDGDFKKREEGGKAVGVARHWHQHQHASRICRVSRASGGKDRHSKVLTAKGLRDRRVRLSVSTAIQFYDLQDRLGVDQPSKAVEWLINAASAAINELPALDGPFPEHPDQVMTEEKPGTRQKENVAVDEEDDADDVDHNEHIHQQKQQHFSLSKSACSSTSETSKGSVLSLSRTECRVKATDHLEVRKSAKEKYKGEGDDACRHHNVHVHNSHSSFTELLTGNTGGGGVHHDSASLIQAHNGNSASFRDGFSKNLQHFPVAQTTTDYFGQSGLFGLGHKTQHPSGFPSQSHIGNSSSIGMMQFNVAAATSTNGDHPEVHQQFSFSQDHLIPIAAIGENSLNFSMSSGLAGFNRGTLQSNSQSTVSHTHHLQKLSSPVDGSNLPFFLTSPASGENRFPAGHDSRLQLYYHNVCLNADLDVKEKD